MQRFQAVRFGARVCGMAAALTLFGLSPVSAQQQDPAAQRGLSFARAHCANCHAVGRNDASRLPAAPPFRTLHTRYPVDDLAESFAEGIVTGHPSMPEWQLDPGQIGDLLAYLKTLER